MTIVLDASAGIEIVLNRKRSAGLKKYISNSQKVISTDLYKAEVTNVIWKYIKADLISKQKGNDLLMLSLNLIDEYHDLSQFCTESLHESIRLNHSSYDMFFLTLARRSGAVLLTMDAKLQKLAENEGIETVSS